MVVDILGVPLYHLDNKNFQNNDTTPSNRHRHMVELADGGAK
eukprot:gene26520-biopygen16741